jgi:hypothetical protein
MVGRPKEAIVHRYFNYDSGSNKSTCLIDGCDAQITGNHAPNLERHVSSKHPEEHKQLVQEKAARQTAKQTVAPSTSTSSVGSGPPGKQPRLDSFLQKKVSVAIDVGTLVDGLVDMVTVNGRPFSVVTDSGFRKILDPVLDGLERATGKRPGIGEDKLKTEVGHRAAKIRGEIKELVKGTSHNS